MEARSKQTGRSVAALIREAIDDQLAGEDDAAAGEASVELIGELVRQRFRQTGSREDAVRAARQVAGLCRLHDVRADDLPLALALYDYPRLGAVDAVIAALALSRRIGVVLSPDRGFDDIPDLQRIDPRRRRGRRRAGRMSLADPVVIARAISGAAADRAQCPAIPSWRRRAG